MQNMYNRLYNRGGIGKIFNIIIRKENGVNYLYAYYHVYLKFDDLGDCRLYCLSIDLFNFFLISKGKAGRSRQINYVQSKIILDAQDQNRICTHENWIHTSTREKILFRVTWTVLFYRKQSAKRALNSGKLRNFYSSARVGFNIVIATADEIL